MPGCVVGRMCYYFSYPHWRARSVPVPRSTKWRRLHMLYRCKFPCWRGSPLARRLSLRVRRLRRLRRARSAVVVLGYEVVVYCYRDLIRLYGDVIERNRELRDML